MDLRQLRYFVAVAERGGFAAAASALNVAQSALSRHIRVLERELGGALLERGARGVSVTESGKVLLDARPLAARHHRRHQGRGADRRTASRAARCGSVRPPAWPTSSTRRSPACSLKRFPRVRFELSEGLTEEMTDRLLRGELDLALVTAPQPNDHLDYETLVVEQVFLIGPAARSAAQARQAHPQGVRGLPAAMRAAQPQSVPVDGALRRLRVDSSTPMKQIVAAGLGYGLLPFSGIHQEVATGSLSAALMPWMRADRVLALPRGRPVSRATRETVTALKTVCRTLVADGKILTATRSGRG